MPFRVLHTAFTFVLLLCAGVAAAQTAAALPAGITRGPAIEGITEYRLPNGLRVILYPDPSKPARDNNNVKPELRNRPLCGLQIMGSLKRVADDAFGDGWVYDPETGKQYSVEITLKGKTLAVRGYIGTKFMGQTREWSRASSAPPKCSPPKAA